ncbi:FG-GAP repeat protein [Hydrogenophaga sp. 2FB]|uniref:FG-GAP repeat protein n=1 Tax=Hydrogenophaga sp. 2FB TaxID=2502187 RepID=UPI001BB23CFC|nr:FG-GAP repeat protein [Hydrogenophaga sp. 2FB]
MHTTSRMAVNLHGNKCSGSHDLSLEPVQQASHLSAFSRFNPLNQPTMITSIRKVGILVVSALLMALALPGCGGGGGDSPSSGSGADTGAPDITAALNYIKTSSGNSGTRFGHSVALSADGTTLAIGARTEDSKSTGINGDANDRSLDAAGAVYVFLRSGNTWVQQAYVKASNTDLYDEFGFSVALSADGNTLAVGAIGEKSSANTINGDQGDNSFGAAGAVYVFHRSAGTWTQQAYVKASNADRDDQFGRSVALSGDGNTLAVGAINEDGAANVEDDTGAVYVFARDSLASAWSQKAYVKASNAGLSDQFGYSVALSNDGKTMAVGAIHEGGNGTDPGDDSLFQAGAAYVFTRDVTDTWTEKAYLKASNVGAQDQFGYSLALSGDGKTLAVGAAYEDSKPTHPGDDSLADAGAVYVFGRDGADHWTQNTLLKASNAGMDDQFGYSLALSNDGDLLVVGARWEGSNATGIGGNPLDDSFPEAGAVYGFIRSSGASWGPSAYIKASNTDQGDGFGSSVALSADGRTLAAGAPLERSRATGVNGDQTDNTRSNAGAVYVLNLTTH